MVADMAGISRIQAKTINLGLFYGMGKAKLQAELGVSKDKAAGLFSFVDLNTSITFIVAPPTTAGNL